MDVAVTAAILQPQVRARQTTLSFTAIYEDYFAFVWRTARRLGVDEAAVDDAVQDVFLVVHRRLGDFEGRSSVKSWLFGITRRVAKDHRRRRDRKDRGKVEAKGLVSKQISPREQAANAEARQVLHQFLNSLDEDKREVFVLAELEQLSAPEIAEATGANVNTVYSRLRVARARFEEAAAQFAAGEEDHD
jgi:RNA polymerase sigma-70 factor (ECF subfamily)